MKSAEPTTRRKLNPLLLPLVWIVLLGALFIFRVHPTVISFVLAAWIPVFLTVHQKLMAWSSGIAAILLIIFILVR
ncbi:hypothetical protein [Oerskovia merdavium]|uniref:Uncharacterized protein n=1 Tax=Oerskovia merdavium TaxID=2762227 RepID=A0ABR8U438_9CELL|nr:hypothetical protein [Oerskovia merdavium]MBD7982808.1 hypothetical protein [Oerskovia merdavium]